MFKFKIEETNQGWDKISSDDFANQKFMEELGNAILYHVILEAKEDLKVQRSGKGQPEGIPDDPKFFESFGFDIKGSSIRIYSTWPQIDAIIQGKHPFRMKWLTKPFVQAIPMKGETDRQILFRTAPDRMNAWVHPGFSKHSFMERGVEKALAKFDKQFANQARKVLGDIPFA